MVAMRGKARSELDCVNPGYPHRHVIRVLLVIECNGARAPQIRGSFCFEAATDGRQLQWIGKRDGENDETAFLDEGRRPNFEDTGA
jgi:hypothetical protein